MDARVPARGLDVGACGPAVQVDGGEVQQWLALVHIRAILEVIEPAGEIQIYLLVHRRKGFLDGFTRIRFQGVLFGKEATGTMLTTRS